MINLPVEIKEDSIAEVTFRLSLKMIKNLPGERGGSRKGHSRQEVQHRQRLVELH